jgi:hypothetical protein
MKPRGAHKAYLSEWFLEFSVLWAVFPFLDQILSGHIDYRVLGLAFCLFVLSFLAGILMVEGDS